MKRSFTKRKCSISLRNRLILTYGIFISLALGSLTLIINIFTGVIFTELVKGNIVKKSREIVEAIEEQYNPMSRSFDTLTIEAMGMYFVHDGYIVRLEDNQGNAIWDARSCDMRECMSVISDIAERMEGQFRLGGTVQTQPFPVTYANKAVGTVVIETYGPFFYSETETQFLTSINRLLLLSTTVFTLIGIIISIALSRAIAKPILKAEEAARRIAAAHSNSAKPGQLVIREIRIKEQYKTKELSRLSRSINELAAELEEGERRQKQLTTDIAHELRTPLACLQGDIEAMIDGVYHADRKHLESCHEEIIRLAKLVQDLNTLTSLEWENITLNKSDFDLAQLLRITAEQWNSSALEKGIAINLDIRECPVNADYDRLKQVFINLLSNAVKYTDKGSITISISIKEIDDGVFSGSKNLEKNNRIEVSFSDTGIGIPEEDLPHIFERFYRTDKSRNRNTGGTGIGLTISAAIVHAHGGTITAENNRQNGGAIFKIQI
ncbi:MAG: two-component sensor histidine kinase [Spirochaetaceae bacterium]|jgi:signal transduction histidine kinase|nr:two-component sensor histidine kinase [Spirochaetaceae bacterium]